MCVCVGLCSVVGGGCSKKNTRAHEQIYDLKRTINEQAKIHSPHEHNPVHCVEEIRTVSDLAGDELQHLVEQDDGNGELHDSHPFVHAKWRHLEHLLQSEFEEYKDREKEKNTQTIRKSSK